MKNGLIPCGEDCVYQENGECSLEKAPRYCLELNAKKACIYYVQKEKKKTEQTKAPFEAFY